MPIDLKAMSLRFLFAFIIRPSLSANYFLRINLSVTSLFFFTLIADGLTSIFNFAFALILLMGGLPTNEGVRRCGLIELVLENRLSGSSVLLLARRTFELTVIGKLSLFCNLWPKCYVRYSVTFAAVIFLLSLLN